MLSTESRYVYKSWEKISVTFPKSAVICYFDKHTCMHAFKRGMEVDRKKKVPFRYVNTGDCCYVAQNSKVFSGLRIQFFLQC